MGEADASATVTESSFVVHVVQSGRRRATAAVASSALIGQLAAVGNAFGRATDTSLLGRVGTWARGSALYRWLTAEPDPAVVVIDLRETWTVGPILRALDWLLARAVRPWTASGMRELAGMTADAGRRGPLRLLGMVVLAGVVANTLVTAALGSLSGTGLGLRLLVAGPALLATRVDASAAELRESRLGRAVAAALEPPAPPEREG